MRTLGLYLLATTMMSCAYPALARQASGPAGPTPLTSPGSWVSASDYPAAALRFDITGAAGFKLDVDSAGKPSNCEITKSSGFDMLDEATCRTVMANARFAPARDRKGKLVTSIYISTVKWQMPPGTSAPTTENFSSTLLSIDQTGKVTACHAVLHVPKVKEGESEKNCAAMFNDQALETGLMFRGNAQAPSAEVEIRQALAFSPELRARVLEDVPGTEQVSLNVHRIAITKDGKLSQCSYAEQRGDPHFSTDLCRQVREQDFDPPFAAFDDDGIAQGWFITRILVSEKSRAETSAIALPPTPR